MGKWDKLEELTRNLSEVTVRGNCNTNEYFGEGGVITGHGLLNVKDIAIQKAHMPVGSRIARHDHEALEYLIVYRGALIVKLNGDEVRLNVGDNLRIEPKTPHTAWAIEDCWLIGITIPAAKGYPGA